jgi:5-oxoprolinase (ATP-hydrolysing)
MNKWKFAVDRGGTFTDVVGLDPDKNFHTLKLLSNSSEYKDPSIEGIRHLLQLYPEKPLPEDLIESIRFGTTVATNALLEQRGGKVLLIVTKGFKDLLEIGYQARPHIFQLTVEKAPVLYSQVFEWTERLDQEGQVVVDPDIKQLKQYLKLISPEAFDAIAVLSIHSWKNPAHELTCEKILQEAGLKNIYLSHKSVNLIKAVSRGHSTVIDAYLSPAIAMYVEGIRSATGAIPVEFIESSGGLSHPQEFKGKDAILSGPAGGVIAVGAITEELGYKGAIGFDMGGTSTDVSRYDGSFEKFYEQLINGIELQKESLNIVTVAAGGGSILWFDGQKLKVGPESAGAEPGPACYGFGGPLTITDANLITGRIVPGHFPRTFGPQRNKALDITRSQELFTHLVDQISDSIEENLTPQEVAMGFIRIASEKMALAIKEISVSRGFDVRDYALICFGGAGGQHACQIASLLDMDRIIFHPLGGVMSAYGIGLTYPETTQAITILKPYDMLTHEQLLVDFRTLEKNTCATKQVMAPLCRIKRSIDLRPVGSDAFLTVDYRDYQTTRDHFKMKYRKVFGFDLEKTPLEIVNIRINIQEQVEYFPAYTETTTHSESIPVSDTTQQIYYPSGRREVPVYLREKLPAYVKITGPAVIIDKYSTLVVDPDFVAESNEHGIILLERTTQNSEIKTIDLTAADPVLLEVFNNLFMGIATEMGYSLRNTAHSVNIKERLDFSCAIFDALGNLIANAPHIPVHLGSMTDTVKAVIEDHQENIKPGDLYFSNNPYRGGSHLPDITVVCPVFSDEGEILFYTAARGHHADVGGATPGSLPPRATHIEEEGIFIDSTLIVRNGEFREDEIKRIFTNHPYPVRNLKERIYDLKAQVSACYRGQNELKSLIAKYGKDLIKTYMTFIQENADFCVRQALAKFLEGREYFEAAFADQLDDSTIIQVKIIIKSGEQPPHTVNCTIDFSGSGPQHTTDNLNTPLSVTRSAILYVLRALTDVDIPLNGGCLLPVEIIVPENCILNPSYPAPVASGNVETSQRIVDVLLGALKVSGASQGTMNNLLFQVKGETPYYETIGGGAGAMAGYNGASAVQVHMTNTRMTDPEVLETRHPGVRVQQFKIRQASGGSGQFYGGDGIIRELQFLKPASISIISERRNFAPYGMAGGSDGSKGVNSYKMNTGEITLLSHRESLNLQAGDSIIIETPGGGGYGALDSL